MKGFGFFLSHVFDYPTPKPYLVSIQIVGFLPERKLYEVKWPNSLSRNKFLEIVVQKGQLLTEVVEKALEKNGLISRGYYIRDFDYDFGQKMPTVYVTTRVDKIDTNITEGKLVPFELLIHPAIEKNKTEKAMLNKVEALTLWQKKDLNVIFSKKRFKSGDEAEQFVESLYKAGAVMVYVTVPTNKYYEIIPDNEIEELEIILPRTMASAQLEKILQIANNEKCEQDRYYDSDDYTAKDFFEVDIEDQIKPYKSVSIYWGR